MVGAVERQRADVNRLPRLIKGLLGSQQNRYFIFETNRLSEFRRADRRIGHIVKLIAARQAGGEAERGLGKAAAVQAAPVQSFVLVPVAPPVHAPPPPARDGLISR